MKRNMKSTIAAFSLGVLLSGCWSDAWEATRVNEVGVEYTESNRPGNSGECTLTAQVHHDYIQAWDHGCDGDIDEVVIWREKGHVNPGLLRKILWESDSLEGVEHYRSPDLSAEESVFNTPITTEMDDEMTGRLTAAYRLLR